MKILTMIILCTIAFDFASARNLLGATNGPVPEAIAAKSEADSLKHVSREDSAPAILCPSLNTLGFQNPVYSSHSEISKILKLQSTKVVSTQDLQSIKDQFMQATSTFRNNFDVDQNSNPVLVKTRARLLSAVGYSGQVKKSELVKLATEDVRWMATLKKMTCDLKNCKSTEDLEVAYDNLIEGKNFKHDLENALLQQMSEQVSVDEMIGGVVIPNERARLRLLSAVLKEFGVNTETRWKCSKTPTGIQYSARIEAIIDKDNSWASDTALASDYAQKSPQICFSSLVELAEQCGKKGASL